MFNLTSTLRGLSASPISTALREARRMARRHLETGGAAVSATTRAASRGFVVPADVDAVALAAAVAAKLPAGGNAGSSRSGGLSDLLIKKRDGRFVVPRVVLERLGGGVAERGEELIVHLVRETRSQRVLVASRARQR